MNEFELIKNYFQGEAKKQNRRDVIVGIGDDCALLEPPPGKQLAMSIDTLVADVHFPLHAKAYDIAQRALRVNLSDLAAVGAQPLWFSLALTFPKNTDWINRLWVQEFSRGLFDCAQEFDIALIGGDTTAGPLSISIQVVGAVEKQFAFLRSGARIGDAIFVSNFLGDGAAALDIIVHENKKHLLASEHVEYLYQRFYQPKTLVKSAHLLLGITQCALDVSDGLVADLNHICQASQVGATLWVETLPLSKACLALQGENLARVSALSGGDDYELCFTVSEHHLSALNQLIKSGQLNATHIGCITEGNSVICELNGMPFYLDKQGYDHFAQ